MWEFVDGAFGSVELRGAENAVAWPRTVEQLRMLCRPDRSRGRVDAEQDGVRFSMRLDDFCNGFSRFSLGETMGASFEPCDEHVRLAEAATFHRRVARLRSLIEVAHEKSGTTGTIAITIAGHADGTEIKGDGCSNGATTNEQLSTLRAETVRNAIGSMEGVTIEAEGRGTAELLCRSDQLRARHRADCDAKNRRFTIEVGTAELFSISAAECDG